MRHLGYLDGIQYVEILDARSLHLLEQDYRITQGFGPILRSKYYAVALAHDLMEDTQERAFIIGGGDVGVRGVVVVPHSFSFDMGLKRRAILACRVCQCHACVLLLFSD